MKKLNLTGITGLWLCLAAIIFGIAANGGIGTISNFIHVPSMIVTLGGALFAVLATADSSADFMDGLKGILYAYERPETTVEEISRQILEMSETARKEGLLSLESRMETIKDSYLKKGITLVVDGTDPELIKDIMENELGHRCDRQRRRVRFWQDFGSYAPAWGMVGTLLGLINMMKSMGTEAGSIGAGMSLALVTTLYGSVIANWLCIPVAAKLQKSSEHEQMMMEIIIEGVLSIQAGENTRIVKEKIKSVVEQSAPEEHHRSAA